MYKYFASYFGVKRRKATIGNAFFESPLPLCEELVREFENKIKEDDKIKKVVVVSVQMLPEEGEE